MKNCIVCEKPHTRKADTCSVSCAAKIANRGKALEAAKKNWSILIDRHGSYVEFPENVPVSHYETFKIKCPKHGYIDTSIGKMLAWKNSCPICAQKRNYTEEGKKQCSVCNEVKTLDKFKLDRGRVKYRCHECDKRIDKLRHNSDKGKEQQKKRSERHRQKKIDNGLFIPKTNISYNKCPICEKVNIKKGRKDTANYCSIECKEVGRKGWSKSIKPSICPKCNTQHFAKSKRSKCKECIRMDQYDYAKQYRATDKGKAIKKISKRKRELKISVVTVHTVIDKKVFERDKWKCKSCGVQVQKNDIYANDAAEVDHIVPLSKGGVHSYSNVQTLCRSCNGKKGSKYMGQMVLHI